MVAQDDRPAIAGASAVVVVTKAREDILVSSRCSLRRKFMLPPGLINDGVIKKVSSNDVH